MDKSYWNAFYAENKGINAPSLFARWVMEQIGKGRKLVDMGCGNGRDSVFFMQNGMEVYGVDASDVATEHIAQEYSGKIHVENEDFVTYLGEKKEEFDYLYSRFTIHAILEEEQKICIRNACRALKPGGKFFIEVRCTKDELFGKGTLVAKNTYFYNGHNRRFIEKEELLSDLRKENFVIEYAEEKTGFAPFGGTDPVVLRVTAVKERGGK